MNTYEITRLIEMANRMSDKTCHGERIDVSVRFDVIGHEARTEVAISSWASRYTCGLSVYKMDTEGCRYSSPEKRGYTTAEMIQILEQIEHYGFREQEQAA